MSGKSDDHQQAPGPHSSPAAATRSGPAELWSAGSARNAPAEPTAAAAGDPPATEADLQAGALIVGLERRRRRVIAEGKSNAWFALPALAVLVLGLLAFALDGTQGNLSPAALLSATAGLFGFLFLLKKLVDDDADEACTPPELAELVGYVTGRQDGTWTTTLRGQRAKDAYLAIEHGPRQSPQATPETPHHPSYIVYDAQPRNTE